MRTFPNAWVFPGGMVDKYGDLIEEIKREIQEEIGITITSEDHIDVVSFYGFL